MVAINDPMLYTWSTKLYKTRAANALPRHYCTRCGTAHKIGTARIDAVRCHGCRGALLSGTEV